MNSIKLIVKLNKYKDKLIEQNKSNDINEVHSIENLHIIEIEAGLVTGNLCLLYFILKGADEVIKNVLREVYQRFKVMLRPKNED